jgi:hypothetical protein
LVLVLGLLLGAVLVAGVYQRVLPPPTFAIRVGPLELTAPCPPRRMTCDESMPFYALWRGEYHADGSVQYHPLYFIYLKSTRPH